MNDIITLLKTITDSNLPNTVKTLLTRLAVMLKRHHLDLSTAIAALSRIKDSGVHHSQCLLDNCRPTCPIRVAGEALKIVL